MDDNGKGEGEDEDEDEEDDNCGVLTPNEPDRMRFTHTFEMLSSNSLRRMLIGCLEGSRGAAAVGTIAVSEEEGELELPSSFATSIGTAGGSALTGASSEGGAGGSTATSLELELELERCKLAPALKLEHFPELMVFNFP